MSSRTKAKPFKACRSCRLLVSRETEICPNCGSRDFTDEWSGAVIVIEPEDSEVAKLLELNRKGRFAVRVE